jgi:hypothetical protein
MKTSIFFVKYLIIQILFFPLLEFLRVLRVFVVEPSFLFGPLRRSRIVHPIALSSLFFMLNNSSAAL